MPAQLDQYTLLRTLGSGVSAKVKLAQDPAGNQVAIKVFDRTLAANNDKAIKLLKQEVATIQKLQHANIVQLIDFKENAEKIRSNGQKVPVSYIVLELVTGGEFFDYVALSAFQPEVCRYYFRQMLQALHFVHSQGVAHRDLKPENIMLDKNFNVKIADFGFAAPLEGRDGSGFLKTVLGTQSYMAPEIMERSPYQGHVVDLFALGIILFIMYSGHPPFNNAVPSDPHYKLLATNRADLFWKTHSNRKPAGFFSEEFKDLITNMLQLMPHQRLSIADIIGHPWMQGPIASTEQVQQEFHNRLSNIKAEAQAEAERKAAVRNNHAKHRVKRGEQIGAKVYMSGPVSEEESKEGIVSIPLEEFKPVVAKNTVFFSTYEPEHIFKQLMTHLEEKDIKAAIAENKWKITFRREKEQDQEEKAA